MRASRVAWTSVLVFTKLSCVSAQVQEHCSKPDHLAPVNYRAEVVRGAEIWDVTVEVDTNDHLYIHWTDSDGTHSTEYDAGSFL